jgi:hypothetical protein
MVGEFYARNNKSHSDMAFVVRGKGMKNVRLQNFIKQQNLKQRWANTN